MRRFVVCVLAVQIALPMPGMAGEAIEPFADSQQVRQLDPDERRLWDQSAELDQAMRKAGKLNTDPELNAYLHDIAGRLFPEFRDDLRLYIVKSPFLNAFAVPNGSLYINEGLIARADNEAQLATVIAHEGIHFTHRHGYRSQQEVKSAAGFALVVALLGVPLVGDLLALTSITGYSRDLERQADQEGFDRLIRAGYDVREAPRVFEHLAQEVQAAGIKEPFFFSSHPRLQERLEGFRDLAAKGQGGLINAEAFLRRTAGLRLEVLQEELAMGRYRSVLVMLAPEHRAKFPPEADFYLGEAYRLRGEKGDERLAYAAYLSAIQRVPGYAPPHRALGLYHLKRADYARAISHLEDYLRLAPQATDRQYIDHYLTLARSRLAQP